MAKQELFTDKNRILRFLVHALGAFAVNREKPELATFKTVKAVFNTSWSLGIFPQGRIIKEPANCITKRMQQVTKRMKLWHCCTPRQRKEIYLPFMTLVKCMQMTKKSDIDL